MEVMDSVVEEIKKRINIIDYINTFVTLKKTGRNFKANCPFHQEKTPSFIVSPERQIWHCFGACQEGGDIFKFLMKWEGITFYEALKEVAEKTGVKLIRLSFEDKIWKKKEKLINMNFLASEYFNYLLLKTDFGKKALEYLSSRLIKTPILKKFGIGYAAQSWDSLLKFLKKKKFSQDELFESGLLVRGERGDYYDRFRGRIMFPIKDVRNNIIGFSGRSLGTEDKSAKYINTPETPIYHKRETLFGIDLAKEAIKKEKNAVLVEGEFDVISPYQYGFENFVAVKGSVVTKEQLMLLKRYTNKITLALDKDTAGQEAVKRGLSEAESLEFEISVVNFDYAKDPDEAVRKDIDTFRRTIKKPIPIYDYIIYSAQKNNPEDDPFSKKRIAEEVIPFMEKISNPIVQSYYVKKLAGILNVSENSVELLIKRTKYKQKEKQRYKLKQKGADETTREVNIQKYLLSLIFQNKNPFGIANEIFQIISPDDFIILSLQKICQNFLAFINQSKNAFNPSQYIEKLPKELLPVFDELYLFASSDMEFENEKLEKIAYEIKKFSLKRKISTILNSGIQITKNIEDELKEIHLSLKKVEKKLVTL